MNDTRNICSDRIVLSQMYLRQYPDCDIELLFCKMLPSGETEQRIHEIPLYYFLQLYIYDYLKKEI